MSNEMVMSNSTGGKTCIINGNTLRDKAGRLGLGQKPVAKPKRSEVPQAGRGGDVEVSLQSVESVVKVGVRGSGIFITHQGLL